MRYYSAIVVVALTVVAAHGQTIIYDGSVMPEAVSWQREGSFDSDRWVEDGWFHQFSELGQWAGPVGQIDVYRMSLDPLLEAPGIYVEWAVETDIPSSVLDFSGVPTSVVAGSYAYGLAYHTTITSGRVQLGRSTMLPLVFVDIDPTRPHEYRLEFGPEFFRWMIDGDVVHEGEALPGYPSQDAYVVWGSEHYLYDNHSRWDYLEVGVIPEPATHLLLLLGGLALIRRRRCRV